MLNPEKTKQLLEALLQGKLLYKIHNDDPECKETLGWDVSFYKGGWGSAFGVCEDRIVELVTDPDRWMIE